MVGNDAGARTKDAGSKPKKEKVHPLCNAPRHRVKESVKTLMNEVAWSFESIDWKGQGIGKDVDE